MSARVAQRTEQRASTPRAAGSTPAARTTPAILAIDPGLNESGWVLFDGQRVLLSGITDNHDLLNIISRRPRGDALAIEMIASYGMPVGRDVFETVWWIGRFTQAWHDPEGVQLVYRKDIKRELCGSQYAKDPHVRQVLIDRFGPGRKLAVGTKKAPGPLHGVANDIWAALAVAVVATSTPAAA